MDRIKLLFCNETFKAYMQKIEELEINRRFCTHKLEHGIDVARIAYIMNLEQNLGFAKDIIYATALLHDIGRVCEYESNEDHRIASVRIAEELLSQCDFCEPEIAQICSAISAHKKQSEDRKETLEFLIYRADKLSRNCFKCDVYDECYWDESIKNNSIII